MFFSKTAQELVAREPEPHFYPANDGVRTESFLETMGRRLLLIEDEKTDAVLAGDLVRQSMPEYAWEIQTASSMTEAIAFLSASRFDLALVDLGLRDASGCQTIDMLCMIAPEVPLVVYSGTQNDKVLDESMRRGAFVCLQKDKTSPEIMRMALTNALSREAEKY